MGIEPTSLFLGFMIGMGVMYTIFIIYQKITSEDREEFETNMINRFLEMQKLEREKHGRAQKADYEHFKKC